MLMVIFVTSLVTVIILIITSASYLISLIYDESEDSNSNDFLGIEGHNYSSTPSLSPLHILNKPVLNPREEERSNSVSDVPDDTSNQEPVATDRPATKSAQAHVGGSSVQIAATSPPLSQWNTSSSAQKSIITGLLGAATSKVLTDDFDPNEVQLGGTALHWSKSRKSLDKLIKIGVPLEIVNKRLETALHVAARRRKLSVMVMLLCNGANLEARNENGETPLIVSCKVSDIHACQLLLTFDANIDAVDYSGFSARHHIAHICECCKTQSRQQPNAAHLILAMLDTLGAKRCPKPCCPTKPEKISPRTTKTSCSAGCAPAGTYNGNSYNRWQNYQKESLYKRSMFLDILERREKVISDRQGKVGDEDRCPAQSRLLSIDGGGMRGVIVCQILIEMEKFLKKPIITYFDWIGGTSVGAFLACALCTGTDLRCLRKICFEVKDEVFSGNRPYSSRFIERVLKRTFGTTMRMSDMKGKKVAVTTTIADRDPCQLRFFRSYASPNQLLEQRGYPIDRYNNLTVNSLLSRRQPFISSIRRQTSLANGRKPSASTETMKSTLDLAASKSEPLKGRNLVAMSKDSDSPEDDVGLERDSQTENLVDCLIDENDQNPLIWQAVRASAAAPFFFKPYGPYLDGGIISNNPTLDMLTEYFNYDRVARFLRARNAEETGCRPNLRDPHSNLSPPSEPVPGKLGVVVSLGTGRGRVIPKQAMVDFGQVASGLSTVFSPVELLRSIRAARDLFKKLVHQSCHTEDYILDRAQAWCASLDVPYFRVNPPLVSIFSIDDKRDEQLINALWQTKLYMHAMKDQLRELGCVLDGPNSPRDIPKESGQESLL